MDLALEEARRALEHGDVPVGAVVVLDGKVIAARHNERELTGDPTAHAEMLALRDAATTTGSWRLEGATLYVTLEPCPMCAGACLNSRLERVVFGAPDPKAGATGSLYNLGADPRLNHEFEVHQGPGADESSRLLTEFFRTRRRTSPHPPTGGEEGREPATVAAGGLPERTNGAASKAVVASGSPWVRIPHPPPRVPGADNPGEHPAPPGVDEPNPRAYRRPPQDVAAVTLVILAGGLPRMSQP